MKKTAVGYPSVQIGQSWPKGGLLHQLSIKFETAKILRRRRKQNDAVEIRLFSPTVFRPLAESDVCAVFLSHNDLHLADAFLAHYRSLGVTRFICLDDASTDGCREFLMREKDVDVWISPVRYRDARRGKLWREALFERYGKRRWYLNLDSDEFLVYQDCFKRPLPQLIKKLESLGESRLAAPMLDFYPIAQNGSGKSSEQGQMPWEIVPYFDASGYRLNFEKRFMSLRGGPRARKLGADAELMKYPLVFWDERCSFGISVHQPTPFDRNFYPISGALLHFKFFANWQERAAHAVKDQQYFDGAREYRKIIDLLNKDHELDFSADDSTVYKGPDQLMEMGFFRRIWDV